MNHARPSGQADREETFCCILCSVLCWSLGRGPASTLWRRSRAAARDRSDTQRRQIEELGKLTGVLPTRSKPPVHDQGEFEALGEDVAGGSPVQPRWLRKIEVVQKETERLERILEDFLRYIGRPELRCEPANVNTLSRRWWIFTARKPRRTG